MMTRPAPITTDFSVNDRNGRVLVAATPHFPIYNSMSLKPIDLEQDHNSYMLSKKLDLNYSNAFAFAALPRLSEQHDCESSNAYGSDDIFERSSLFNAEVNRLYFDD